MDNTFPEEPTSTVDNSAQNPGPIEPKRPAHLWKPGQSGNPLGRPPGIKNKTTLVREMVEAELTEMLATDAKNLLKVAIDRAQDGNDAMLKLLIDKMLPMRKAEDGAQKKQTPSITINVGRTGDGGITIDGKAEHLEEENDEGQ